MIDQARRHRPTHPRARRATVGLAALLGAALAPACSCGDLLAPLPAPAARLSSGAASAPPLPILVVELPPVSLDATAHVELTLANDGDRALSIIGLALGAGPECAAPGAGFSVVDAPAAGALLDPGAAAPVRLAFTPVSGQPSCTVLTLASDDPLHPALQARLVGRGDAPALCADRPAVDFGAVPVDERREEVVRVASCGTRPITVAALGVPAAPFGAAAAGLPRALAPGEAMEVTASFTPPEERAYQAGVELLTDVAGAHFVVELRGAGVRLPVCRLTAVPAALHLGTVAAGRRTTADLLVHDAGLLPCTISSVQLADPPGPFSIAGAVGAAGVPLPPGAVLVPGESATVTVELAPDAAHGTERAVLVVASDDPVRPELEIPIEGNSVEPTPCLLEAAPTSLAFGFATVGATAQRLVVLRNIGSETCSLRELSLPSGAPAFAVLFDPPPIVGTPLAAGAALDVVVTFHPEAAGPVSGTVRARYRPLGFSSPEQTLDVPLSAHAVSPCISVTPATVDFGAVGAGAIASAPVAVASCGAAALRVRGLVLGAGSHRDFAIDAADLAAVPAVVAPGATLVVDVQLAPTDDGGGTTARFGALQILSDDPDDAVVTVPLRANAAACAGLVCAPAALELGVVPAGESIDRPLACRNFGAAPAMVSASLAAPTGAAAGNFTIVTPSALVAPGDEAIVRVRFTAASAGSGGEATARIDIAAPTCGPDVEVHARAAAPSAEPPCPTASSFDAAELWRWSPGGGRNQVFTTPIVSRLDDTDGDGALTRADAPRVIFAAFAPADLHDPAQADANAPVPAVLTAVDGRTGALVWAADHAAWRVLASATPAAGDLDGDGHAEIVAVAYTELPAVSDGGAGPAQLGRYARGRLLAFASDGSPLWQSDEWTRRFDELEDAGAPALGDVDGDGRAEIALGDHLFDARGHLLWRGGRGTGSAGRGPLSVLADVDGQPGLELVAGRTVYRADGTVLWDRADLAAFDEDGLPAVGDLDGDGRNEVIMRSAALWIFDGRTGVDLADSLLPPQAISSGDSCDADEMVYPETCYPIPAPIALLDLDGVPGLEIVVPNKDVLLAYRFDRDGPFSLQELWRLPAFDATGAAGAAGFDFLGDGSQDVIFADEQWVSGWAGDGALLYEAPSASITAMESAAVADVDGDGHAEILVANNDAAQGSGHGLVALSDPARTWPRARGVWNQHAFVPDLVDELGALRAAATVSAFRGARGACR